MDKPLTTTLFKQIMVTDNRQQKMLMNLRHSAGFRNFLQFLILLVTVYSI